MKSILLNLIKDIYLFGVSFRSHFSKKRLTKPVFLLSFPSTSEKTLEALYEKFGSEFIICYTANSQQLAEIFQAKGCQIYPLDSYFSLIQKVIPLVKGSKIVLCDNYFAFLGAIDFFSDTKVVQLWHANGAIKNFGLKAHYAQHATSTDQRRYQKVYQKFTHYMVSSEKMAKVFAESYNTTITPLPFGYLPADVFFDETWLATSKTLFQKKFGTHKKVLLYVPTYREQSSENPLDLTKLNAELGADWLILVKAHPHDEQFQATIAKNPAIITDFKGLSLNQLLPMVDCLVTDYSSIPFEYSLANPQGKMLFFCYDFDLYNETVGLQPDFLQWLPGPLVKTPVELLQAIKEEQPHDFTAFNQLWNTYNHGQASEKLMQWMEENND